MVGDYTVYSIRICFACSNFRCTWILHSCMSHNTINFFNRVKTCTKLSRPCIQTANIIFIFCSLGLHLTHLLSSPPAQSTCLLPNALHYRLSLLSALFTLLPCLSCSYLQLSSHFPCLSDLQTISYVNTTPRFSSPSC